MKLFIKALSLLLVLMMLEASLVACADIHASFGTNDKSGSSNQSGNSKSNKDEGMVKYLEFPSNDPEWRLYWEDFYLKLSNGDKTFEYGDYRGDELEKYIAYALSFSPVNEERSAKLIVSEDKTEAIILYDGVRYTVDQPAIMYACVVELENGTIIQDAVPRPDQFLEAHGYTYEDLIPYHAGPGNNGLEYATYNITLTAEYRDGKPYFEGRLLTDDGKLDLSMVVGQPYNIGDDFKSLKCDGSAKTLMTAFIEKDTKTLETFYGYETGMLDGYKTLEFGSYKATVTDTGKVLFTVDVTKSGLDTIPAGEHVFELSSNMYGYTMLDVGRSYDKHITTKAERFVHAWLSSPFFDYRLKRAEDIPEEQLLTYSTNIYDFLAGYFSTAENGSLKANDFFEAARAMFGLSDAAGFFNVFNEAADGTLTYKFGHGGAVYNYDFVESSDTYAIVQFYADDNYTVKSHLVRYDFEDGDYPRVVSSRIIEKSEYEPFHYCV